MYNAMISPLMNMTIKGAIWYTHPSIHPCSCLICLLQQYAIAVCTIATLRTPGCAAYAKLSHANLTRAVGIRGRRTAGRRRPALTTADCRGT